MFRQPPPTHPLPLHPPFPTTSSYTPLPEYEAQTPQSFHYPAKDVLYAELRRCTVCVGRRDVGASKVWRGFLGSSTGENGEQAHGNTAGGTADGVGNERGAGWTSKKDAGGFITSAALVLLPPPASQNEVVDPQAQPITSASAIQEVGVRIPYPSVQLHAVRNLQPGEATGGGARDGQGRAALYLQVEMGVQGEDEQEGNEDEDMDEGTVVEVLIIPDLEEPAAADAAGDRVTSSHINGNATHSSNGTETDAEAQSQVQGQPKNMQRVQELYAALSACQDLHPDPHDSDSDDDRNQGQGQGGGGLAGLLARIGGGAGMPGEGGWITSENAHLFEGEFPDIPVIGGGIGDEEVEAEQAQGGDGVFVLGPGAGRRREREGDAMDGNGSEGGVEETKWQRTG